MRYIDILNEAKNNLKDEEKFLTNKEYTEALNKEINSYYTEDNFCNYIQENKEVILAKSSCNGKSISLNDILGLYGFQ